MPSKTMQAAKVYLHFLKAVKKHIGNQQHKKRFTDFLPHTEFLRNNGGGDQLLDSSSIQHKVNIARYYTFLLNSVHHHKDLLVSYNVVVNRLDEMKRILGKSTASLGRQLPDVHHP